MCVKLEEEPRKAPSMITAKNFKIDLGLLLGNPARAPTSGAWSANIAERSGLKLLPTYSVFTTAGMNGAVECRFSCGFGFFLRLQHSLKIWQIYHATGWHAKFQVARKYEYVMPSDCTMLPRECNMPSFSAGWYYRPDVWIAWQTGILGPCVCVGRALAI